MRFRHQLVAAISCRHACELFQSSRMSWSSKIMKLGTLASSHRTPPSSHDSR
jgi:hypothetical protein